MHVHKQGSNIAYHFHTTIFIKTYYYDANRRNVSVHCVWLDKHTTCFYPVKYFRHIHAVSSASLALMDYEYCRANVRQRFWVDVAPNSPSPDLTLSAALPGFSALSSADRGWQMSWMDFCPEEGSGRGAPALIALIGSDRAGVFISQQHDPRQQTSVSWPPPRKSGTTLVSWLSAETRTSGKIAPLFKLKVAACFFA